MPDDDRDVDASATAVSATADQKPPRTRKSRHLLRLPFTKSGRRSKRRTTPPPLPDEGDLGKGCYLCFLPPRSPPDAATGGGSKPPSGSKPPPTYEFLKSMIEKNDFYSPECNVHRDIPNI